MYALDTCRSGMGCTCASAICRGAGFLSDASGSYSAFHAMFISSFKTRSSHDVLDSGYSKVMMLSPSVEYACLDKLDYISIPGPETIMTLT